MITFCAKSRPLLCVLVVLLCLYGLVVYLQSIGFGLSYQGSKSMPEGWYVTYPLHKIKRGDTVVFYPPQSAEQIMLQQHWIEPGAVMMKQVYGMPGDKVCHWNHALYINHHRIGPVLREYKPGHFLPNLSFCRDLSHNEYMLMSTHIVRSFDSRYFGPISRDHIIAKAQKL